MKKTTVTTKKTSKTSRRQTLSQLLPERPSTAVQKDGKKTLPIANRHTPVTSQRKASTPTHDKPPSGESPDVSRIMPTEISSHYPSKEATAGKPILMSVSKTVSGSDQETSLVDQLDFEYTRYLQTMFRRKLAETEASEVDDKLTVLQKRIAENQNILQRTTERLKNINFNKEVETLHKLRNPNYGRVLETLDNANCEDYLEIMNKKLEQSQNQLKMKNIELPQGGGTELLQIMKETLAACEKLKVNNNLEVPKVIAEIKATNHNTSETLSRCLEMVPEVENLSLHKATLEICANAEMSNFKH